MVPLFGIPAATTMSSGCGLTDARREAHPLVTGHAYHILRYQGAVGLDCEAAPASRCRYWWTKAIAMLPSPTAEATRLTGLNRTSPHAKMPGTLVSSR